MLPYLQTMSGPIKGGYRVPTGPTTPSIMLPFQMPRGNDALIDLLVNAFRGVGQMANVQA